MKPKIPKKIIASTKKGKVPPGYSLYLVGSDSLDPLAHVLLQGDAYWVEDFEGENWSEWGLDYPGYCKHYLVILSKDPAEGGLVLKIGEVHEVADYIQERYEGDRLVVGLHRVVGYHGTATAGDYGTAIVGVSGTATAGHWGTATAGDFGTAIAGVSGTATAGYHGTAIVGERGIATAGDSGRIEILFMTLGKSRKKVGYIGEDGLKPNVKYRLNEKNEFEEVEK